MHKIFSENSFHLFKNWKNGLEVGFTLHSSLIRTRIVDFRLILFFQRWSSLKIFYYFVLSLFEIRRYEGIWKDTVCLSRLYPLPSNFLKTVFHKFHLVHSWILCPIWSFPLMLINCGTCKQIITLMWLVCNHWKKRLK